MKKYIGMMVILSLTGVMLFSFSAFTNESKNKIETQKLPQPVYQYWKNGKAEINNYELFQKRYGEQRKGNAVMIFVTEPFLPETQVKYDGIKTSEKVDEVLKLNFSKNFFTGVYPYSIMTSVFTPFNKNILNPYKITMSSQDWCGQSFYQLNNKGDQFDVKIFSYFQKISDVNFNVDRHFSEDNIWNTIRLNSNSLPLGEFQIIPSAEHVRLNEGEFKPTSAKATLNKLENIEIADGEINSYRINFTELNRSLEIYFDDSEERKILGWDEIFINDEDDSEDVHTKARLKSSMMLDYWNKNSNSDSTFARQLGLFDFE